MEHPYYGQIQCRALRKNGQCPNKAYYMKDDNYFCGVHAKSPRIELQKDPNTAVKKIAGEGARKKLADEVATQNKKARVRGSVIVTKIYMMKVVEYVPGYISVFPNYRHGNRSDGIGCATLSPMSMCNIDTAQPGLPLASSLENAHQAAKVFPSEVGKNGEPLPIFFKTQLQMYKDTKPQRHKYASKDSAGKRIAPLYSVWRNANGVLKKFTYVESRQFYCNWYERCAQVLPEYKKLMDLLDQGYNLQICGYDGYEVTDVAHHYLDPSRPFGHELVLYTMLVVPEANWPWRIHKTEEF